MRIIENIKLKIIDIIVSINIHIIDSIKKRIINRVELICKI